MIQDVFICLYTCIIMLILKLLIVFPLATQFSKEVTWTNKKELNKNCTNSILT